MSSHNSNKIINLFLGLKIQLRDYNGNNAEEGMF